MESSINVVNRQKGLVRGTKGKKSETLSYKQFCTRCGKSPTHDFKDCPARDATCHKCSHGGHFKKYCRSADRVREIYQENSADSSDDTTETFIGVVDSYQESPNWYGKRSPS